MHAHARWFGCSRGSARAGPAAGGVSPRASSSRRSAPAEIASTTSLTVPPSRARIALSPRARGHGAVAAARAQRPVEAAVGRGDQPLADERSAIGRGTRERVARVKQASAPAFAPRDQRVRVRAATGGRHRRSARRCASRRAVAGAAAKARRRAGSARDIDRAHAVDQAMVSLGDERPAPVLKPVQQHSLPQRAPRDPSGARRSRRTTRATRRRRPGWEGRLAHLRRDVETRRRLPVRPRQVARARPRELFAVARQQIHPPRPSARARVRCPACRLLAAGRTPSTAPKCIVAPSSACSRSRNIVSSALSCSPISLTLSPRPLHLPNADSPRVPMASERHGRRSAYSR